MNLSFRMIMIIVFVACITSIEVVLVKFAIEPLYLYDGFAYDELNRAAFAARTILFTEVAILIAVLIAFAIAPKSPKGSKQVKTVDQANGSVANL